MMKVMKKTLEKRMIREIPHREVGGGGGGGGEVKVKIVVVSRVMPQIKIFPKASMIRKYS